MDGDRETSPITPYPAIHITPPGSRESSPAPNHFDSASRKKSVVLESLTTSSDSDATILTIKLKIDTENKSVSTTFNYNLICDTPSITATQLVNDYNISSSYIPKIKHKIIESLNLHSYKMRNKNENKHNEEQQDILSLSDKVIFNEKQQFIDTFNVVLMEGVLSIYSNKIGCYIKTGGILTNSHLYLFNVYNYKLWEQFMIRTKIGDIIKEHEKNGKIIDEEIMKTILQNLNISTNLDKIESYLLNKKLIDIKSDILMNMSMNKSSLSQLFGLKNEDILPSISRIKISGFFDENIVSKDRRNEVLQSILMDVTSWIEQEKQCKKDLIVTLNKCITSKIVENMNNKLNQTNGNMNITIAAYNEDIDGVYLSNNKNNDNIMTVNDIICLDLSKYTKITAVDYGLVLSNDNIKQDVLISIENENKRFEWISCIDYILYLQSDSNESEHDQKKNEPDKDIVINLNGTDNKKMYDKYVHDFKQTNHHNDDEKREYISSFGFGVNLNYWSRNELNSVIPRYKTLKEELMNNAVHKITEKKYYALYENCSKLMRDRNRNKTIRIYANHLLCMKLFTENKRLRQGFMNYCKRYNQHETMKDLIMRNCEIGHFCRFMKECCNYFGDIMNKKAVYIGINSYLLFNSIQIKFECPILSTMDSKITQKLTSNKNGVILSLKPVFNDTKCYGCMNMNNERVIYGEYMNISNIFINGVSNKLYISAIRLFEDIINGYYHLNHNETTQKTLYSLITDYYSNTNNIKIPKYIRKLFANIIDNINDIWMNKRDLRLIKNEKLRKLFYDFTNDKYGELFKYEKNLKWIQSFKWDIDGDWFNVLKSTKYDQYIKSQDYHYKINDDEKEQIIFNFELFPKYIVSDIDKTERNLLRFYIKSMPKKYKGIKYQIDIICKDYKFQYLSKPKWIDSYDQFTLFPSEQFKDKQALNLLIGIKILDISKTETKLKIKQGDITNNDIDIDILTQKLRNEILNDMKQKMEKEIETKYKSQLIELQSKVNSLNETINLFGNGNNVNVNGHYPKQSSLSPRNIPNKHPPFIKSHSYSKSYSTVPRRRKKTFTLMDSTM